MTDKDFFMIEMHTNNENMQISMIQDRVNKGSVMR